jgi:nicotinate-nucleotide adenylyltransferase
LKIGVMGGTFDPIHIGHLVIAEEARAQFELETVVFVPSARPPHKVTMPHAPALDRLRMAELAVEGNRALNVSELEVKREGISYTIDTLRDLHGVYGSGAELFFITGADAILEMLTWKDPEKLLAESKFIAATRPGYALEEIAGAIPEFNSAGQKARNLVFSMEIPALAISSTDIRERVCEGRPFRYLVPDTVWGYIIDKRLYVQR